MKSTIYKWINSGLVDNSSQQQALILAEEMPDTEGWVFFIKRLLVLLGMLSLAVGVVFFFAYNWNEMGRQFKFITIEILLLLCFIGYFIKSKSTWVAQAFLFSGVVVLGALLALFGQTYQTGADPWQLFATWALLIFPLVLFSRSEVMWLFLIVLGNVAMMLYLNVNRSLFGIIFHGYHHFWVFLFLNLGFLLLLEWLSKKALWTALFLNHRWAAQVTALLVLYILCMLGMEAIWGNHSRTAANVLLYICCMTAIFFYYRLVQKDLLILTAWAFSLIFFILALLAETVFDDFNAGGLLLMAISLIGMSTLAVSWIKKTHKQFKQEAQS